MPLFNRELWLNKAVELMAPDFKSAGLTLPSRVYISVGPTQFRHSTTSSGNIGVTWHEAGEKGVYHVFISPSLTDSVEVLATLLHELIHCCFPPEVGHKKPFGDACRRLGLTRPWTATDVSEELEKKFVGGFLPILGEYKQPKFDVSEVEKPGSRLLKAECPNCGYIVRLTRKWANEGLPLCGSCDRVQLKLAEKPEAV